MPSTLWYIMYYVCIIICRKGDDYSRFQAAKDLFDAFLNRTQAYGLHHLVGLITFKSHVTVNLALTEKLVSFTVSLNNKLNIACTHEY